MKNRHISYEKLSKRQKREIDSSRRRDWGGLNPVTRKPEDPKIYNRSKLKRSVDDAPF